MSVHTRADSISNQSSNQCESDLLMQLLNATSWRLPLSESILPGLPFPPLLCHQPVFFSIQLCSPYPVAIRQYTLDRLQLCQRAHTFTHTLTPSVQLASHTWGMKSVKTHRHRENMKTPTSKAPRQDLNPEIIWWKVTDFNVAAAEMYIFSSCCFDCFEKNVFCLTFESCATKKKKKKIVLKMIISGFMEEFVDFGKWRRSFSTDRQCLLATGKQYNPQPLKWIEGLKTEIIKLLMIIINILQRVKIVRRWSPNLLLGFPPEELANVAGEWEVWASLLRLLPPWTGPG